MRIVVLVDGEHYPPVVRAAVDDLRAAGHDVLEAVFCGGTEKIRGEDLGEAYGVPVVSETDVASALDRVLAERDVDTVVDLSDEPVLGPTERYGLARVALLRGVAYRGPDFEFRPPPLAQVLTKPSVRVIATGKRTGKTAVAGALARHAVGRGRKPVIVAMGRGGPAEPVVLEAGTDVGPEALLEMADAGRHAASDYVEDAVTSHVATIGCRRVGGGLAGAPWASNVVEGARLAEQRDEDLVILEGSGAAVPPVAARAGIAVVPAGEETAVSGHFGPYRLLLADLAVVTMGDEASAAQQAEAAIRRVVPHFEIVRTVFRPRPLGNIKDRRVFFCTTAPDRAGSTLRSHLESEYGCEVVGMSHHLSDRSRLRADLERSPSYEVLLTELKAAAVDVAVRSALAARRDVVVSDNDLLGEGIAEAFDRVIARADVEEKL